MFAGRGLFAVDEEQKRSGAKDTSLMFTAETLAVVATAALVVWAKLATASAEMPNAE